MLLDLFIFVYMHCVPVWFHVHPMHAGATKAQRTLGLLERSYRQLEPPDMGDWEQNDSPMSEKEVFFNFWSILLAQLIAFIIYKFKS